jgi:uncharacterized protein (DUF488 family)
MAEILTLYTIGHSNLSPDDFLALLRQHQITVLVDVRSAPYSRYVPHFNKNQLQAFLQAHDIAYRFAGEFLGGQPKDETAYKAQTAPESGTQHEKYRKLVDYEAVMQRDWYQRGIERLLDVVRETTAGYVAIMCSEGNPLDCHRHHLIARSLLDPAIRVIETNIKVLHIITGGKIESVDSSAFENLPPYQPRLL